MMVHKTHKTYSVVSYFCGCGGLDLGLRGDFVYHHEHFERLPFEVIAAYDNEPKCIETYNDYFGDILASVADLATADVKAFPAADILVGGFPCQDFSSCGPQGGLETDRGQLYKTLISYMKEHGPKMVVGENVVNLERMGKGALIKTIIRDLEDVGYKVNVWKLYAPDYGIPQNRTRLFFICVRDDIAEIFGTPIKPEPTFIGKHRSIEWAIGDLIDVKDASIPNQDQYFGASKAKRGNGQGDENNKKDQPAYTIRANPKSRVQFHYSLDRRLTVRECARIQTFPDDFIFKHAKTASVSQIGNAVPPMLGHVVGTAISTYLHSIERGIHNG